MQVRLRSHVSVINGNDKGLTVHSSRDRGTDVLLQVCISVYCEVSMHFNLKRVYIGFDLDVL